MAFRADECLIGRAENPCYACGAFGPVACVVLPHDAIAETDDDSFIGLGAHKARYIVDLDAELQSAIGLPTFRLVASKTAQHAYYAHHCPHCDALQGDWYLHGADGVFWPEASGSPPVAVERHLKPVRIAADLGSVSFELGEWTVRYQGDRR